MNGEAAVVARAGHGAAVNAAQNAAPSIDGAALYAKYCKLCHAADGSGYAADNAPSLVSKHFLESATDEYIAQAIRLGRSNTAMAAYGAARGGPLDEPMVAALVRFLRSKGPKAKALPNLPIAGSAEKGQALFGQYCVACHALEGQRGTAPHLRNPEFVATAPPEFVRHAIVHGRPPTPMPAYEGKLTPAQIEDLVAFITKPVRTPAAALPSSSLVPADLPMVINPRGKHPKFTLRDERFVSAEQVKRALDAKQRMVIIDARSPADWIQFHIPGSVPVPYYSSTELDRIPNDGTWVIAYCACPHHASGEIVDALRRKNYKATAVLDEGILFWRDRGYPLSGEAVSKSRPSPAAPPASAQKPPRAKTAPSSGPAKP